MSEKRETILRLVQDEAGRILDVKVEQRPVPEPKLLTVIELKPETKVTFLRDLTEGSIVDWGDGTKSAVTAEEAKAKEVTHTYTATSTANRIVTIDGVIDRTGEPTASAFDPIALTAVRSLGGGLRGEAEWLFYGCSSLTAIPEGLFDHCTEVTDFSSCFSNCVSLTAIPAGLFDHCTAVIDFFGCFFSCSSLTAIPAGLFDHCTAATNFLDCFNGCSSLTAIPAGLFDHCTAVESFHSCFKLCTSLTGETPYTMVNGKKVKLWERSPENGFGKVYDTKFCFYKCAKLSDYAKIPRDWK